MAIELRTHVLLTLVPQGTTIRTSIVDVEGWRVTRFGMAPVIDPGRADVGMAQPFLDPDNVGIVFQGAGGGSRTQGMWPHVFTSNADLAQVSNHHFRINLIPAVDPA